MNSNETSSEYGQLVEAAYRQTLARFNEEVATGERDPVAELPAYRKRRRDYATLLRLDTVPEEARELTEQLLATHHLSLEPDARRSFERDIASLLIRLYEAFIRSAEERQERSGSRTTRNDQGNK